MRIHLPALRRMLPLVLPLMLPLTSTACAEIFGEKDAKQPGTPLGTFHVVGTRSSNTCGEGALGTSKSWEFDVDLARDDGVLFWNNGAQVLQGALDADDVTFAFDATVVVDMRTEQEPGPPCSIERRDGARGVLDDTGKEVLGFAGSMAYDFAPVAGSLCDDLVSSAAPTFAKLPCGMKFGLKAERTEAPPSE